MKKLIFVLGCLLSLTGSAQQDALFSQYMFNPFAINPAYAGSRNSLSGVMLARRQWAGFSGAPTTGTFAVHSPFKGKNFALGFNGIVEEIGPSINSGAFLTYAYHLRLPVGKLSLGLRGGVFSSRFNNGLLNFDNPNDINNTGGIMRGMVPNFDFGLYYYTQKFFLGLSSSHITGGTLNLRGNNPITIGGPQNMEMSINRHYVLATGVALPVNPNFVVKPSVMVRYVNGAPINVDVNTSVLLQKKFWVGFSYRTSNSLVAVFEYNVTDFLRLGYSYDYALGKIRNYNNGSHELFIGLDLNVSKKSSISTRYL
jgi:type IX secretion system PorP/SprF family membrane protein